MTRKDKQNHIFQNSKSYEISNTVIYISKDHKFVIHVFYWCIPLDHEIYTDLKKHLTLLKVYLVLICSGIKIEQVKKNHLSFRTKCSNFTNFFRMPKIKNSILSNEKQRLKNEAWTTSRENIKSIFASYLRYKTILCHKVALDV